MSAIINTNYAEALINVAYKKDSIEKYADFLEEIEDVLKKEPKIGKLFSLPGLKKGSRVELINELFSSKIKDKYFMNFMMLLAEHGRIKDIPGIFREYLLIAKERYDILSIIIETPVKLTIEQIEDIKRKFKDRFKVKSVRESIVSNKELIGGVRVRAGNMILDNSLKRQLQEIEKSMGS